MNVLDVLTDAYIAYRGKSSNIPAVGTDKYNDMLTILNRKQREWWSDNTVDWPSLFQLVDEGDVALGTQTYDIDTDIIRPSDYVMLTDSNNNVTYVNIIKPQLRSQYTQGCYLAGSNPVQLTFITVIDATLDGQDLTLPCFVQPAALVNPTDSVAVDDPNWLIYAVAAELARNDYSKEEQYPNLNGIANGLYQQMIDNANANSILQPNGVPNNMPQYDGIVGNQNFPFSGPWSNY